MKTTYYVALHTGEIPTFENYHAAAGVVLAALEKVLQCNESIASYTKGADITAFSSEVEIGLDDKGGVVGSAVVDIEGPKHVALDKGKIAVLLKAQGDWAKPKVEKRTLLE
jgi:hypothetical protein